MILPHPNKVFRIFYPDALWRVNTKNKEIYLTFDDGPTPGITEKVLELLQQFNAHATFFCLGCHVDTSPGLYDSILKFGHSTGLHSHSHLNGRKTKNKDYFEDIEKSSTLINSNLFRPPYGAIKQSQYKLLKNKYKIVFWDVMAYDFHPKIDSGRCFQIIKKYTNPGSVIVFHDTEEATPTMLHALKKTLEYYSGEGYSFKRL